MNLPIVGLDQFQEYVEEKSLFVDKTLFIRDFMMLQDKVSVFLRPRRFGKTTNLSLLKSFLSLDADKSMFEPFAISKETDFCSENLGQYPVLQLDFKDSGSMTWKEMKRKIWLRLCDAARPHLKDICWLAPNYNFNSATPPEDFEDVLKYITEALYHKHKRKVIVLVDEYDAPLNNAYQKGFYEEASKFFGNMYSAAFKSNAAVKKACLVGIMEIRGSGIFSKFNNAFCYSVADEKCSQYFGFTLEEIREYCPGDKIKQVLEWYNGYTIGNHKLINPWSFCSWLKNQKFMSYWVITSDVLSMEISENSDEVFYECLEMAYLGSKKIIERISMSIDHSVGHLSTEAIWNKLIHSGYLSFEPSSEDGTTGFAVIPNRELRKHWQDEVQMLLRRSKQDASKLPPFLTSTQIR